MQFPNYDQEIRSILPYYDSYHSETINLIKATGLKPKTWLDTGCGTGSLVELALKHFPDTQFILADPSAEMLIEAKRKLYGSKKVIFLNTTSTQDLIKETISRPDIITAVQCHHYLSNEARIKATKVCYDLLVKDGIYVTFENIRPMTKVGIEIGKRNWGYFQLSNGRGMETIENHLKRFDSMFFPITVEDHLSLLRTIGFQAVELLWHSCMQSGFYCIK